MPREKQFEQFYKLFFNDFIWAVKHLSPAEVATYIELTIEYWVNECQPLPIESLKSLISTSEGRLNGVLEKARGVVFDGTHVTIPKLDRQFKDAVEYSEKQAARRKGSGKLHAIDGKK